MRRSRGIDWSLATLLSVVLWLVAPHTPASAGGAWEYTIGPADTPAVINPAATSAVVDTAAREIRLPSAGGKLAALWPDGGPDYVVAASGRLWLYLWDGTRMVQHEVAVLGQDPVAVAAPLPYPDVAVLAGDTVQRWSFNGSGWGRNPALEVAGLSGVTAMAVRGTDEVGVVVGGEVQRYRQDPAAEAMVRVPEYEPGGVTALDVALRPDAQEVAVLESERVRFFAFAGAGMIEVPWLTISGLAAPRGVSYGDGGDVVVVDGSEVRHYAFSGGTMVQSATLTLTAADGLVAPSMAAVRPGSYDRIVVDGDQVRYYRWDSGTGTLVYDAARSVTVPGLSQFGTYAPQAVAQSQFVSPDAAADRVRVMADHQLAPGTQVTWSVTADGSTWVPAWRVRADGVGQTYCEVAAPDGTWEVLGTATVCGVAAARLELWVDVPPGTAVGWRAVLEQSDGETPRVRTTPAGGVAIRWQANARPLQPSLLPGPGAGLALCATTATPAFAWQFRDPDPGDVQAAYQIQVFRLDDDPAVDPPIYDSGRMPGGQEEHTLPVAADPAVPGPLWASGTYQYKWRVRVWDARDGASDWSALQPFCVTALERLRVVEIVAPPDGQVEPDPDDPATHIVVLPDTDPALLPRVRAGARVRVVVDGIGPAEFLEAAFLYTDSEGQEQLATLGDASPQWEFPPGSQVNRWSIDFWTDADVETVPPGTLVLTDLTATGAKGDARLAPDPVGVVVTEGSIHDEFYVVLWR